MAEIPVEKKTSAFPWWVIPLLLLLLLLPLFYFCSRNTAVVDNTNTTNANRSAVVNTSNSNLGRNVNTVGANTAVVANNNGGDGTFNEAERIRKSNEEAQAAIDKIYPNGTAEQVIEALNLAAINFANGSAVVPESDKPMLKKSAEMLKKSPADTRVEIGGYTDNTGDDAANLKLSEQRAAAVRNVLVGYGVPSAMLSSKGYGEANPKASNDTAEGRFQNRRIEYKVATGDASVEKVAPNAK